MFFLKELTHTIVLDPKYLGPFLNDALKSNLYRQIEGTCTGRYGYVIAIVSLDKISQGRILDYNSTGGVAFDLEYTAVLFKPFKNEVVDAIVENVNKMGFFAYVGPFQIFVSNHHIPSDFRFESSAVPPCYLSQKQGLRIATGDTIRVKIFGTRADTNELFAIGSIKEDYLGVLV